LRLSLIIEHFCLVGRSLFLGRVFGDPRHLLERPFFVWMVVHSKILTLDNLGRMGMVVVNRCWLCETEGESVDHLLLHCATSSVLWNAFFARFGLCWVMPRSVKESFASWWTGGHSRNAVVWKMVSHYIMWCIWREHNNRCFEDSSKSREKCLFCSVWLMLGYAS
jgi:hypothetical protein